MKKIILFCYFLILLTLGCSKDEPHLNAIFVNNYFRAIDHIGIECDKDFEVDKFISGHVMNSKFCFYHGVEGRQIKMDILSKFSTPSPVFNSMGTTSNARNGCIIRSLDLSNEEFSYNVNIHLPDFPLNMDTLDYLDSIFAIKMHSVIGADEVVIPDGTDFVSAKLIERNGGFLSMMKIDINAKSKSTSGNVYQISSIFGSQEQSFVKINQAKKIREGNAIYYYLEIEFECSLYLDPQSGSNKLWSKLTNGKLEGMFRMKSI